jgi:peptidoglycan/LPS O-acetylase OafA/YrhL
MNMARRVDRIDEIDGMRCMAVLAVMSYHYLNRYAPPNTNVNYYPYEPVASVFSYGYYGVQLFFVISGFVIYRTLEGTRGYAEFLIKRLIRLLPSMALCSLFTYFAMILFSADLTSPFQVRTLFSFFPGITFLPPEFWNFLLHREDIHYLDGAYWSLFAEALFYLVGGFMFFKHQKSFTKDWINLVLFVTLLRMVTSPRTTHYLPDGLGSVFQVLYQGYFQLNMAYWVYFALGIFFYSLYNKEYVARATLVKMIVLIFLEFYFLGNYPLRFAFVIILVLFLALIYRREWIGFLRLPLLVQIGVASYPLYLLHENIGVILIRRLSNYVPSNAIILVPTVMLSLIGFSRVVYYYYEWPVLSILKKKLIQNRNPQHASD